MNKQDYRIQMPYMIVEVAPDRWCLLNREYMPLGLMRGTADPSDDPSLWEAHAQPLQMTDELRQKVWHGNRYSNDKASMIALYHDGNPPWLGAEERTAYNRRREALMKAL